MASKRPTPHYITACETEDEGTSPDTIGCHRAVSQWMSVGAPGEGGQEAGSLHVWLSPLGEKKYASREATRTKRKPMTTLALFGRSRVSACARGNQVCAGRQRAEKAFQGTNPFAIVAINK